MLNDLYVYANNHGVNPQIFILIYLISIPFFYYPFIKIKSALRDKNKNNLKSSIISGIIVISLAWASPYLYIVIFGKELPSWLYALLAIILLLGLGSVLSKILKRSNNEN